jgi:hypothetical protein
VGTVVEDDHVDWDETATQAAAEFFTSITDAASAAEDALAASGDMAEADAQALLDVAGEATVDELAAASVLIGAAEPLTAGLDALLPDLEITLRVIARVDQLLQEMA